MDMERLQRDANTHNAGIKNSGIADSGAVVADLGVINAKSAEAGTWPEYNAQLLGYTSEYLKEEYRSLGVPSGMTETDRRLREDLMFDERYFVILMAYDYNSLKGGKTGSKPKLLWSNHFSMRATGHNFTTALPAMSKVAANYFGRNVDGLLLDAQKIPAGAVEIGEPKTIEGEQRK